MSTYTYTFPDIPTMPVEPEQSEEDRAKASLPEGWLWFGRGPVKTDGGLNKDIDCFQSSGRWYSTRDDPNDGGFYGKQEGCFYALRAGSEIARLNGLEPVMKEMPGDVSRALDDQIMDLVAPTPDFPAVGTRLRFIVGGFAGTGEQVGAEIEVLAVTSLIIKTTKSNDEGEWWFDSNWRDGLEVVPTKPSPPVRPEGVPYEGDEWIYAGIGFSYLGFVTSLDLAYLMVVGGIEWTVGASGGSRHDHYAIRRGSPIHRAQPWFDESQLFLLDKPTSEGILTYPPPESEWPPMPDPGDGMRWEREDTNGVKQEGEIYISLLSQGGKLDWFKRGPSHPIRSSWHDTVVFRAVPEWRELGPEEKPRDGDEVQYNPESAWLTVSSDYKLTIGSIQTANPLFRARTRRPLPEPVKKPREWSVLIKNGKVVSTDSYCPDVLQIMRDDGWKTIRVREVGDGKEEV